MSSIAIVGAGRLADQFAAMMRSPGAAQAGEVVYFGRASESSATKRVVDFDRMMDSEYSTFDFYLGLGYRQLERKRAVLRDLLKAGRRMPPLIHASAVIDPSALIGPGCAVYPGVVIGPGCVVAGASLLNVATNLAHDVEIGEATYLSPSVAISGFCRIGAECFLGTGTLMANDLAIGDRCRIGIGSVITRSLPDGTEGLGNPFRLHRFELV